MGTGKIDKEKMKELGEIQELLWKNRLKAQVLKEYFNEDRQFVAQSGMVCAL